MKSTLLFILVGVSLAANCETPKPDPVAPPQPPDVPVVIEVEEDLDPDCASACGHQRALGCAVGMPTAEGATCEEVCGNSSLIPAMAWDVARLTNAISCE